MGLRGVLFEDGVFEVWIGDEIVGDENSVDNSKEEQADGWSD